MTLSELQAVSEAIASKAEAKLVAERDARFFGERAARWIQLLGELRIGEGYPAEAAIDNANRNAARAWHYANMAVAR